MFFGTDQQEMKLKIYELNNMLRVVQKDCKVLASPNANPSTNKIPCPSNRTYNPTTSSPVIVKKDPNNQD